MNDRDEMLRYGLDRMGDQARPVDLDRRAAQTASTVRRWRIAIRATAGLVGLVLTLSVAVALRGTMDDTSRVPLVQTTPTPTSDPSPSSWLSTADVAAVTGLDDWDDTSDRPSTVSRTGLKGCGTKISTEVEGQDFASLVDSASFLGPDRVGAEDQVVYRVYRFYTPMAAFDEYQYHARDMEGCRPDDGGQGLGEQSSDPGSTDVRWREALASWSSTDSASSLVVLRDRYVAILSWTTGDRRLHFGSHDEERAAVFVDELVAGTLRHERDNPLPAWALSWTGELGPEGMGGVRLGMTEAEAMATGQLARETSGDPCSTSLFRADYAGVLISDRHGVVAIDGGPRTFTPEGLREGTTFAEFKRMYPNFRGDGLYQFSAPVPGNPDARYVVNVGRLEGEPLKVYGISMWSSVRDKCLDSRLQVE